MERFTSRIVSALENGFLASLVLAMAATVWLVVPQSYQLVRQVGPGEADLLQKTLIACYSMSLYFAVALPFCVVLSILGAALLHVRSRRLGIASTRSESGKTSWRRRVALGVGCLPLLVAALGFVHERSQARLSFDEVESSTGRDLNVVLVVVDSLRADHLGVHGNPRDATPFLDSLSEEGVRFERCHVAASWTKPSVASILTSLYPGAHGANHFRRLLPLEVTTVGEVLQEAGFVTYAYVANPNLKAIFRFDQGFDFFDDHLLRDKLYLAAIRNLPHLSQPLQQATGRSFRPRDWDDAGVANGRILRWLDRYHGRNFFMYLHYMDPHIPYSPPPPYDTMFSPGPARRDRELALYDGEIRFFDDNLAVLLSRFEELGIYEKTLFIITSDHGEAFGEHGDWRHDHSVYQEQLHVPLIVVYPEVLSPGVVDTPVRSVDIVPTILDFAGAPPLPEMEGRSLRELMEGEADGVPEEIFVDHYSATGLYRLRSLIAGGRWKYIKTLKSELRDVSRLGDEELYDLESDPTETRNLVRSRETILSDLRERSAGLAGASEVHDYESSSIEELDEATERQLRALGYLESGEASSSEPEARAAPGRR